MERSSRSDEFLEGYNACKRGISRPRNPYQGPTVNGISNILRKFEDWHDGWSTCFHGEAIYEGTPDP